MNHKEMLAALRAAGTWPPRDRVPIVRMIKSAPMPTVAALDEVDEFADVINGAIERYFEPLEARMAKLETENKKLRERVSELEARPQMPTESPALRVVG